MLYVPAYLPSAATGRLDQGVKGRLRDALLVCDPDDVAEVSSRLRRRIELGFPEPESAEEVLRLVSEASDCAGSRDCPLLLLYYSWG
jgi:hypothetical protein